jgi:hypothetical protein
MAYHEAYWAVAGGIGPVLALASVVGYSSTFTTNTALSRYQRKLGSAALKAARGGRRLAWVSYWLACVGFAVDLVITVMALGSLSRDRDGNDPAATTLLIVLAFILLLAQIITAALASDRAQTLADDIEDNDAPTS